MKRFFGVMPAECVEMKRSFRDNNDLIVTIEAGPGGWTIIWADHNVDYCDVDDTAENNFKKACIIADEAVGPLKALKVRI